MPPTGPSSVSFFPVSSVAAGSPMPQKTLGLGQNNGARLLSFPTSPRRLYRGLATRLKEGVELGLLNARFVLARQRNRQLNKPALVVARLTLSASPWFDPDIVRICPDGEPLDSFIEISGRESLLTTCRLSRIQFVDQGQMLMYLEVGIAYGLNGSKGNRPYRQLHSAVFNFDLSEGGRITVPNAEHDTSAGDLRIVPSR